MERKPIHEIANDFVAKVEEEYLDYAHAKMKASIPGSPLFNQYQDRYLNELTRLYSKDEDHEENWIDMQKFKRWMNGDNNAWDEHERG